MSKEISRREFVLAPIKFAARNAGGIIMLSLFGYIGYGVWKLNEKEKEMMITNPPLIKGYLDDDLVSTDSFNLDLLRPANQQELIKIIESQNNDIWSQDRQTRWISRLKIANIISDDVLGTHTRGSDSDYDKYKNLDKIPESVSEKFMEFLDGITNQTDQRLIESSSPKQQANMWVEAVLRTQSFISASSSHNPTQEDGVYVRTYLALYGMIDDLRFIPLQNHKK